MQADALSVGAGKVGAVGEDPVGVGEPAPVCVAPVPQAEDGAGTLAPGLGESGVDQRNPPYAKTTSGLSRRARLRASLNGEMPPGSGVMGLVCTVSTAVPSTPARR